MSEVWTEQRVIALAPDAASAKAGQGQAKASKWPTLGQSETALWGEVQGSGKNPYQVRIDLREPAFKCSCPSRKFPCKHALGLLLIYAQQADAIATDTPPQWVTDWLDSREQRAQKQQAKAQSPDAASSPVDEKAQAKRIAKREEKVQAGVAELGRFLSDVIRQGLATAQTQKTGYWEQVAARMVDAQAPGLARRVRLLGQTVNDGERWQSQFMRHAARLHLLIEGYSRMEQLSADLQSELRGQIGWTQTRDELLTLDAVVGRWCVIGQQIQEEDKLKTQLTWLTKLDDGKPALIINFAAGNQPLDTSLMVGTCFDADLIYYPAAIPLRAILKQRHSEPGVISQLQGMPSLDAAMQTYAAALATNPWLDLWPVVLSDVLPIPQRVEKSTTTCWYARDHLGMQWSMPTGFGEGWEMLSISGGNPVTLTGLWDGDHFDPMGMLCNGRYYTWQRYAAQRILMGVS